ncbi:MAG: SDR family oxidoreductase [Aliidongia sp.]
MVGVGRDIEAARRRFPSVCWIRADLALTTVEDWTEHLRQADAVVNCAGALQDSPRDDLHAVHVIGVVRIAAACAAEGVRRFIHVSAAGVAAGRATAFNRTKLAAETVLAGTDLDWVILCPGLVLAPAAYGGTALLRGLAALPGILPIAFPDSVVQVVSVHDLAEAGARVLADPALRRVTIDLVHEDEIGFETLLLQLRQWLGLPPGRVLHLPVAVTRAAAKIADGLACLGWRSPMRSAALEQLRMGVRGESGAARRRLGLELQSLRQILDAWPAGVQERWFSRSYFLKPAILATLAVFWFLSGLIGITTGFSEAVRILTVVGVASPVARGAVIAGALIDMALGIAVAFRRAAPVSLRGMLFVSAAYLVCGTLLRPDLWLDPLGPLLKIIPGALLAAAALAILDER